MNKINNVIDKLRDALILAHKKYDNEAGIREAEILYKTLAEIIKKINELTSKTIKNFENNQISKIDKQLRELSFQKRELEEEMKFREKQDFFKQKELEDKKNSLEEREKILKERLLYDDIEKKEAIRQELARVRASLREAERELGEREKEASKFQIEALERKEKYFRDELQEIQKKTTSSDLFSSIIDISKDSLDIALTAWEGFIDYRETRAENEYQKIKNNILAEKEERKELHKDFIKNKEDELKISKTLSSQEQDNSLLTLKNLEEQREASRRFYEAQKKNIADFKAFTKELFSSLSGLAGAIFEFNREREITKVSQALEEVLKQKEEFKRELREKEEREREEKIERELKEKEEDLVSREDELSQREVQDLTHQERLEIARERVRIKRQREALDDEKEKDIQKQKDKERLEELSKKENELEIEKDKIRVDAEKREALLKKISVGINGAAAIAQAWARGPIVGAVTTPIILAMTTMQIAKIEEQSSRIKPRLKEGAFVKNSGERGVEVIVGDGVDEIVLPLNKRGGELLLSKLKLKEELQETLKEHLSSQRDEINQVVSNGILENNFKLSQINPQSNLEVNIYIDDREGLVSKLKDLSEFELKEVASILGRKIKEEIEE